LNLTKIIIRSAVAVVLALAAAAVLTVGLGLEMPKHVEWMLKTSLALTFLLFVDRIPGLARVDRPALQRATARRR